MRSRLGLSDLTAQCVANARLWQVGKGEMTQAATEMARELELALNNMAQVYSILGDKIQGEQPLDPVLSSIPKGCAQALARVAGLSANFGPALLKRHGADIRRQTNPRPNEPAWNPNVRGNR